MASVRIGISGWRYKPWRGVFYPENLPQHQELEYASATLPTIEINGSFHSLQRPENQAQWHAGEFHLRSEGPALHHSHAAIGGRRMKGRTRPAIDAVRPLQPRELREHCVAVRDERHDHSPHDTFVTAVQPPGR